MSQQPHQTEQQIIASATACFENAKNRGYQGPAFLAVQLEKFLEQLGPFESEAAEREKVWLRTLIDLIRQTIKVKEMVSPPEPEVDYGSLLDAFARGEQPAMAQPESEQAAMERLEASDFLNEHKRLEELSRRFRNRYGFDYTPVYYLRNGCGKKYVDEFVFMDGLNFVLKSVAGTLGLKEDRVACYRTKDESMSWVADQLNAFIEQQKTGQVADGDHASLFALRKELQQFARGCPSTLAQFVRELIGPINSFEKSLKPAVVSEVPGAVLSGAGVGAARSLTTAEEEEARKGFCKRVFDLDL